MLHDPERPHGQRVKQIYGWEPRKVSHHPIKFGGHRLCGIGDNGFSLSRDFARPRDQRVRCLYKYEPIKEVSILSRLVAIGTIIVEILRFSFVM